MSELSPGRAVSVLTSYLSGYDVSTEIAASSCIFRNDSLIAHCRQGNAPSDAQREDIGDRCFDWCRLTTRRPLFVFTLCHVYVVDPLLRALAITV